ncbi:MAG: DUF4391 domain-containing protein [Planctomycetes bacterium]|nr:DUF4391 domain-containing protein [Planctomycetota bacterium]
MNGDAILAALGLPESSRVELRVPKTLFVENGAPTAADKRHIESGIEEIRWVAALKPSTIGVGEFRDQIREYLEVAVLRLVLREGASAERLAELLHRAVPYPVLLLTEGGPEATISAVHKRWAQNEAGKVVLDGEVVAATPHGSAPSLTAAFAAALSLARLPRLNLFALYQGWVDAVQALNAGRQTGAFRLAGDPDAGAVRAEALGECARLEGEIARLRGAAARERQMARQVDLNLELKRAEAALAAARARL